MFLSGQAYPMPWDEPVEMSSPVQKDKNFYGVKPSTNMWQNPHRVS